MLLEEQMVHAVVVHRGVGIVHVAAEHIVSAGSDRLGVRALTHQQFLRLIADIIRVPAAQQASSLDPLLWNRPCR